MTWLLDETCEKLCISFAVVLAQWTWQSQPSGGMGISNSIWRALGLARRAAALGTEPESI